MYVYAGLHARTPTSARTDFVFDPTSYLVNYSSLRRRLRRKDAIKHAKRTHWNAALI